NSKLAALAETAGALGNVVSDTGKAISDAGSALGTTALPIVSPPTTAALRGPDARVLAVDAEPELLAAVADQVAARTAGSVAQVDVLAADLDHGVEPLRAALAGPADLVWASVSVHHVGDQQAAVTALAGLLAPGGRLALAE